MLDIYAKITYKHKENVMKIGVSSYSFSKYIDKTGCDYFHLCDKAKELGFDGIEFINLDWKGLSQSPLRSAKEISEYCKSIGLEIAAYTVGADFFKTDDPAATVAVLKQSVQVAAALSVKVMRHDVVWSLPEGMTWEKAADYLAPYVREVSEYARGYGIRTCTENHGYIFQAPERVEYLINKVSCDNYGWLVDTGNFLCADCEPLPSVNVAAKYAFHVHAKDFLRKSQPVEGFNLKTTGGNFLRGTVVGHGVVPVKDCLAELKNSGYDGWVSLEFEGAEEPLYALETGLKNLKAFIESL